MRGERRTQRDRSVCSEALSEAVLHDDTNSIPQSTFRRVRGTDDRALTEAQGIDVQLSRAIVSSVLNGIVQRCADAGEQLSFPYVSLNFSNYLLLPLE